MNLVDSCGWLEYYGEGPNARHFAPALRETESLVVPTICLFEVFRAVYRQRGRSAAFEALAGMRQGIVVDLDAEIACHAGELGIDLRLPLADSIILTTARSMRATLWTQDRDFEGMDGVEYFKKHP